MGSRPAVGMRSRASAFAALRCVRKRVPHIKTMWHGQAPDAPERVPTENTLPKTPYRANASASISIGWSAIRPVPSLI